jgi:hypothetical protein
MEQYLTRARQSLTDFDTAAAGLAASLDAVPASPKLPKARLAKLGEIARRLPAHTEKIRFSLGLTEQTAVDIVDLLARLEGQCAALAADLAAAGDLIEKSPDAAGALAPELLALEERAERLASAIFPNAIEGLRDINRTLWDFRPIALDYDRTFAEEVARTGKNRMTAAQLEAVRNTAVALTSRFDDVNNLLNRLAVMNEGDGASVKSSLGQARRALADAVKGVRARASDAYKPFHGALGRIEKLARKIDGQFAELRVPVFPSRSTLGDLETAVDERLYAEASGVQRMALLNIAARLKSITFGDASDDHLLSRHFKIRIFDLYPSRVYLTADASFLDAIRTLAQRGLFVPAPAALHRFNEGSFKQKTFRKGNLQVSFAAVSGEQGRFNVDADIDLYRSAVRHLFGEVLVNHLTGSTTDQFRVYDILASASVKPIGRFDVVMA